MIDLGGAVCLTFRGDALTERIESDSDALTIDCFGHAKRILNAHACDEATVEAGSQAGIFEEATERAVVGECNKTRTKNGHDLPLPWSAPGRADFADRIVSHTGVERDLTRLCKV